MNEQQIKPIEAIGQKIFIMRGMKVMLDYDLAELYQVLTKNLNLAVRRNIKRFPADFMFQLSAKEFEMFNRSQIATGSEELKDTNRLQFATGSEIVNTNRFQIGTGSQKHRDPRFLPYAFTEHGVAMLSSVLRSQRAVEMNILIIRAFIRMREILASNKELGHKVEEIEREQRLQNKHINAIYRILGKFIAEPVKPKGPMGFRK